MRTLVTICALLTISSSAFAGAVTCKSAYEKASASYNLGDMQVAAVVCEEENYSICANAAVNARESGEAGEADFYRLACELSASQAGNRAVIAGFSDGTVGTNGMTKKCFEASSAGDSGSNSDLTEGRQTCDGETNDFCNEIQNMEGGDTGDARLARQSCAMEKARGGNLSLSIWVD